MSESSPNELVLVLDAGGTKTSAWVAKRSAEEGWQILGRGRSTGGNPTSVGFAEAVRIMGEAVAQAQRDAGLSREPAARALLSIAGVLDQQIRRQISEWARSIGLAGQISVVPDVLPVLAAGSPDCCGVALICGTGSAAFARAADGCTCLCGGWGYLLGDEGSGYAIGRAALRAVLEEADANSPLGPMAAVLLQPFAARTAREAARSIYTSENPRSTVASLASLVIRAAERGDPQAAAIIDAAAHDLAPLAIRAARGVGISEDSFALAITGGVIVSSERLQKGVRAALEEAGIYCQMSVVKDPLKGCLRLAEADCLEVVASWQ